MSKRKIFIIAIVVLLGCVVAVLLFSAVKKSLTKSEPPAPTRQIDTSLTPEQNKAVDILANLASTTPKDTPEQTAAKLDILKAPPSKIVPSDATTTDAQKLLLLQSLTGGAKQ